jgi:hypothetical protein
MPNTDKCGAIGVKRLPLHVRRLVRRLCTFTVNCLYLPHDPLLGLEHGLLGCH